MKLPIKKAREIVTALHKAFTEPVIEVHIEEEPPADIYIIAFLAFVGTLSIVYFTGVIIINLF